MSFDQLFPLSAPPVFVYDLLVRGAATSGSVLIDAEGKWSYGENPGTVVRGYLAPPNTSTINLGQASGVQVDTVALISLEDATATGVAVDDEISATGIHPLLDGRYLVKLVRPNPSHVRLLCSRIVGQVPSALP